MAFELILASASPRRRELLGAIGLPFQVQPSDFDEEAYESPIKDPYFIALMLASEKAQEVKRRLGGSAVVLGADTVVVVDDEEGKEALGKPESPEAARKMLRRLSGATHWVCTGLALAGPGADDAQLENEMTEVRFRELSDAEIDAYIATGEPFDKAGGYGIQGGAAAFVEKVAGDYYNVVGLPLAHLREMLAERFPELDLPAAPPAPDLGFPIISM